MAIEGPYGCLRPLRQFDSVVLLAGSTGATFTLPLLRDIVQGWKENANPNVAVKQWSLFKPQNGTATRCVRFVWVIKSKGQLSWFSNQLSSVYSDFQSVQERLRDVKLELTIFITCDNSFTEQHKSLLSAMTTPYASRPQRKGVEHGVVEYRGCSQSVRQEGIARVEKEEVQDSTTIVTKGSYQQENACRPDGTCYCRATFDDNSLPDNNSPCCCSDSKASHEITHRSSISPSVAKQELLVHLSISVFSGRPKTRDIIRRSLEQALGESAVVVCGPQGLVADVKQNVCSLSDERAVHKGTGAQGIYLHTESFGY